MKIAIVADTHNNWANFKKAIEWISNPPAGGEKIQLILHCGDVSSQEIIDDAKKLFGEPASAKATAGEVKFVKGNADYNLDIPEKIELEIKTDGNVREINPQTNSRELVCGKNIALKRIAFCHFPNEAKKLAQSGEFNVVFYGHTHRPWDELVLSETEGKKCHMINPGELAGQFYKPSFAIYDTDTGKLELKILEKL